MLSSRKRYYNHLQVKKKIKLIAFLIIRIHNTENRFFYQIPQILYSSIVTAIINTILKNLSLSERDMLKIKQQKDIKFTVTISKDIKRCIYIRFGIFIVISLLLMLFFWYFISCFCAVYNNTQIILFKDTLLSFGLSMLYPIGLSLLPGIFRIPSLRSEKKNKKCLYSFSQIVAML